MKIFIQFATLLATSFFCCAEDFREWTEADTGRKIQAKILEKTGNTVKILLKNLKQHEIPISKLSFDDQNFVKDWVKHVAPHDQLTVRVIKATRDGSYSYAGRYHVYSSNGSLYTTSSYRKSYTVDKILEVYVNAGDKDVTAKVGRVSEYVERGKTLRFYIEVDDDYDVLLVDDDGNPVDRETNLKKTGVGKIPKLPK